jgi:Mg2+ and Co2+ transporter CorA
MFVSKDDSIINKKDDLTVDYQASLKTLGVVKYQVLGLSKLTHSKSEICRGLIKKVSNQNLPWEGIQLYLGDVEDHAVSLNQGIAHIETILRNLHACYTTHMSLKVIQQDQLSLTGSLRLTYFGAVVSVGLTVSGTWGMRMLVPGQPPEGPEGEGWPLDWFFAIIGVTLAVALILAYLANRFASKALASDTNTVMDPTKTIDDRPPNRAGLEEFNNRRNSIVTWLSKKVQGASTNGSNN